LGLHPASEHAGGGKDEKSSVEFHGGLLMVKR